MKQVITYNGNTFPYTTMNVSSSNIYNETATHVATIYTFRITGTLVAVGGTATLDSLICAMRSTVMEPRKEFKVDWQDDASVSQYVPYWFDQDDDVDFGPRTQSLQLYKFTGGKAAIYDWTIVIVARECWSACTIGSRMSEILSLTQQFSHHIDVNGMTTRTVSGKLTLTSSAVRAGVTADNMRMSVTPPIPLNYRRTGYDFSQSPDGRELTYSVTDQEQVYTLPQPATDGNATWSVTINEGMQVTYSLSGYFTAPATVPKATLLALVGQLAQAKFPIGETAFMFTDRNISESVYDNRIDFSISALSGAGVNADGSPNYNVGMLTFTVSPPNDGNMSYPIMPYGGDQVQQSGTVAGVPILWDACTTRVAQIQWNRNAGTGGGIGYDAGNPRPPEGENPYDNSGASADHATAPWISYNEVYSWEVDNGIKVFAPKGDAPPIIQQVHAPKVVAIQAGYSVRYAATAADGATPRVPKFPFATGANAADGWVCTHSSLSSETPEPIGDGTSGNKYTSRWRYVYVRSIETKTAEDLTLVYPQDPRRANSVSEPLIPDSGKSDYNPLVISPGMKVSPS